MSKAERSMGKERRGGIFKKGPPIEKYIKDKDVPALVAAIDHPKKAIRSSVIAALGEIGDEQAIEPVSEKLSDPVRQVRIVAVEAIGKLDGEKIVKPLTEALRDPSLDVRVSAMEVIKEQPVDPTILPILGEAIKRYSGPEHDQWCEDYLEDTDSSAFRYTKKGQRVRRENWDGKVYEAARVSVDERFHQLEAAAVDIAKGIKGPKAITFIEGIWADKSSGKKLQEYCLDALEEIEAPAPKQIVESADPQKQNLDWSILRGYGGDREWKTGTFMNAERKLHGITEAMGTLAKFDHDPVAWDILINGLSHPQPEIQIAAITALGKTKNADALPYLERALHAGNRTYTEWHSEKGPQEKDATEDVTDVIREVLKEIPPKESNPS